MKADTEYFIAEKKMPVKFWHTDEELASAGIDRDELISWAANEYADGYFQSFFNEEELEAGKHYDLAREYLVNCEASWILREYKESRS
jgi:hypothetical protein